MAKVTHKEKYVFKKGQTLHLDDIYDFQGVGVELFGQWWKDDNIVITRDIEIQITIKVDKEPT